MKTNCKNCLNCIHKGKEWAGGAMDGGYFDKYDCLKGLVVYQWERRTDCNKYVSKDTITMHYVLYSLYKGLGLIITFAILILLLSQMPWFISLMSVFLLVFGFIMKSK